VNLQVGEGAVAGLLIVGYLPPGMPPRPAGDPGDGSARAGAPTASGGTVTITSRATDPTSGPAPFGDRLGEVAERLAALL
jgi:hypothetical protein